MGCINTENCDAVDIPPVSFRPSNVGYSFWLFVSAVLNQHSTVIVVRNCVEYVHVGIPAFTASFTPSNRSAGDGVVIADEIVDPVVVAPVRVAPIINAPVRLAFVKFAFVKLDPVRSAFARFTPEKSTPVKSVYVISPKCDTAFKGVLLYVRRLYPLLIRNPILGISTTPVIHWPEL